MRSARSAVLVRIGDATERTQSNVARRKAGTEFLERWNSSLIASSKDCFHNRLLLVFHEKYLRCKLM